MWEKQRDNREFVGGCDYIFGHYSFRWRRLFWFLLKLLKLLKCKRVGDERIGRWKGLDDDDHRMDGCWCCDICFLVVAVRIKKKKKIIVWEKKVIYVMNFVSDLAALIGGCIYILSIVYLSMYVCFFFSFFLSLPLSHIYLSIYIYSMLFFSLTSACSSIHIFFQPSPLYKRN